jgi:NitT/TauT family transport system permease protein
MRFAEGLNARMRKTHMLMLESLAGFALALLVWEVAVRTLAVPRFILPPPSETFLVAYANAPVLAQHAAITILGTFVSLASAAVLGLGCGLLVGYSRVASRLLYPLLGGFHALPMSAFIPIFVVWFGIGPVPKVLAGALIAFFPVVVNVVTGLRTIEPELWEMLKVSGATKGQVYRMVGIPRTLPYFFASLKVAAGGAFIGNVVGEMIASGSGLGYVLVIATTSLNMPLAFAALTILLVLGMAMFMVFDVIERKAAPWAFRGGQG